MRQSILLHLLRVHKVREFNITLQSIFYHVSYNLRIFINIILLVTVKSIFQSPIREKMQQPAWTMYHLWQSNVIVEIVSSNLKFSDMFFEIKMTG